MLTGTFTECSRFVAGWFRDIAHRNCESVSQISQETVLNMISISRLPNLAGICEDDLLAAVVTRRKGGFVQRNEHDVKRGSAPHVFSCPKNLSALPLHRYLPSGPNDQIE
jgi:hypothetical protein